MANGTYETVKIERDTGENAGLTWVILNRPEKRNAMSPELHYDMQAALDWVENDNETKIVVLGVQKLDASQKVRVVSSLSF